MVYPDIDVVVTSSCRKQIIRTIKSFKRHFAYSGKFGFLVNIDVVKGSEKNLNPIQQFLQRENVRVLVNRHPTGLAEAVNRIRRKIETPYYFNLEDDWQFLQRVNLDPLVSIFENHGAIDHIRFSKEPIAKNCWLYHHSLEKTPNNHRANIQLRIDGINLVKTFTWSFNPSLNRTAIAKTFPDIPVGMKRPETYICRFYEERYNNRGAYFYGRIGSSRISKDIGRPFYRRLLNQIRKMKGGTFGRNRSL